MKDQVHHNSQEKTGPYTFSTENQVQNLAEKNETVECGGNDCFYVQFHTQNKVTVVGYKLITASDAFENYGMNPTKWYVVAKENEEWITIDYQENYNIPAGNEKEVIIKLSQSGEYQYFRFMVTGVNDMSTFKFQLAEFNLLEPKNQETNPNQETTSGSKSNSKQETISGSKSTSGSKLYSDDDSSSDIKFIRINLLLLFLFFFL